MPQVTFEPLPIFQRGEGLEVDDNLNEGITVNYVDADNSWTLVQRRKKKQTRKNNQEERWNKQQKENFLRFGDIYQGEPYKNYRNVNVGPPVANIPLQQQVVQPPFVQPAPAQPQPAAVLAPHLPQVVVVPPPDQLAQAGQFSPGLEAIPEEDEEEQEDETEPQGAGYRSRSSSSSSSAASSNTLTPEAYGTPPDTPDRRDKLRGSPFGSKGEALLDDLRRLAVRADADTAGRHSEIPIDEGGERAPKIPGPGKLLQHELAEAGPPSQRTRQMQKDLEKTLLKRYEENKALEKKRKKEIKKEQP
jgi:hypothetical protein